VRPYDTESPGGALERIAGHLRAIVGALDDFTDNLTFADDYDGRRGWLYEVLLNALEREAEAIQAQAERVYALGRTATEAAR
jgi:hypothetical protein